MSSPVFEGYPALGLKRAAPAPRILGGVLAAMLLAACAAGPDFKTPAPPSVSGYADHPLAATEATPGVSGSNT